MGIHPSPFSQRLREPQPLHNRLSLPTGLPPTLPFDNVPNRLRTNVQLHCGLPTLAPLMARADLAIGAAGVTTWERLCLGLPSLVITVAEHQRPIAEKLQQEGLIRWLGDQDVVAESTVAQVLEDVIQQGLSVEWSNRCRALVDGLGVQRACVAMGVDT